MKRWPILVISLIDDNVRRQRMRTALLALGLDFEFVDAIDGRRGLPSDLEIEIDRLGAVTRVGRKLSDGEWACALSHRAIYRKIIRDCLDGAVVLEDDAIVGQAFKDYYLSGGYIQRDLIQLDHMDARRWRWEKARNVCTGVRGYTLARSAHLCSGYSISRRGAAFLSDEGRPLQGLADWPLDLSLLEPLAVSPKIVTTPDANQENSWLELGRAASQQRARELRRIPRLLLFAYWRRKIFKLATRPIC